MPCVFTNMSVHEFTNRLISASSPYLLQHAHNPVDWWEWCDEAFEKARKEDKPILVSIGYSACHWCHVMERESFEDLETAKLMNELFVCIKVDREERPDVDQLYMDAVQLLTGRGGWPLNCFALPDGRPLHGGTYFPKQEWQRVLRSVSDFYHQRREEAMQYATDLTNGIKKLDVFLPAEKQNLLTTEEVHQIANSWKSNFDNNLGGYTWAPKFPMPNNWEWYLMLFRFTKDEALLIGVMTTLTKMAEGGIYDQVGGGFARYSTDVYWKVPHFEKMLYDNAQLVSLYCDAYKVNRNPVFERTVKQTLAFIKRELTSDEGVFYSALDADSEGEEGKYYVWTQQELKQFLGDDEPLYSLYYSVDVYGNWEHGNNILYKTRSVEEIAGMTGKSVGTIEQTIAKCNAILLEVREKRVKPGLDDKMITSWNAMMIKAYAVAYLTFGDETYLNSAKNAADFIWHTMWDGNTLKRIYKNGKASIMAFAEDYALLCEALIKLGEATGDERYFLKAHELMAAAIDHFYDKDKELFYFKSKHDRQLATRKIDVNDDVVPGANSTLAKCLLTLSYLFDKPEYLEMADKMVLRVQHKFEKFPTGFSNWMQYLIIRNEGFRQLVVTGVKASLPIIPSYEPNLVVLKKNGESQLPLLADKPVKEEPTYYLCIDKACGLPQADLKTIIAYQNIHLWENQQALS